VAFVGDTAGICRAERPCRAAADAASDIDLDAWRISTDRILNWNPDVLFLTHFGPQRSPRVHFGICGRGWRIGAGAFARRSNGRARTRSARDSSRPK
jgi:hypothetical protein